MAWSLEEFRTWALQQGRVAKFDDGQYSGECVSLINQYCYRVLEVPAKAWGHAKDWATNATVLTHFDKVSNIRAGDILVYPPTRTNPYGHIEIALASGQAIGQNRLFDYRVRQAGMLGGYIAILRKKGKPEGDDMTNIDEEGVRILAVSILGRKEPITTTQDLRSHIGGDALAKIKEFWYSKEAVAAREGQRNQDRLVVELQAKVADLQTQLADKQAQPVQPQGVSDAERKLQTIKDAAKTLIEEIGIK